MTQRRRLDAFLVEQAVEAGPSSATASESKSSPIRELRVDGEAGRASTRSIGADGANGTTARTLGLGGAIVNGVALEGNLPYERLPGGRWRGHARARARRRVPGGYGWIFPKGDHVNVGVGGWGDEGPRLREHLRVLCEHYGSSSASSRNVRGHRLPMRRPGNVLGTRARARRRRRRRCDRPRLGRRHVRGVRHRAARRRAHARAPRRRRHLEPYPSPCIGELDPLASAGWGAKMALDRFPRAVFTIMRLPVTWRVLEKLMLGEVAHPGGGPGGRRASRCR